MKKFIRLAGNYPNEIVGIDIYGEESDCRKYLHEFCKYTKILQHYHISCQAIMNNYKDLQSELINYSITSFSRMEYKQNLSLIYRNLSEIIFIKFYLS
ncbi:unnamed protein product [Adineta steineri]|uniref:Uncharacterized protein n=1 Tax=Adineta steineri TaxID=433720 RepID=A0A813T7X5_9BILA|nr:unnamed protein product [Adineta steineri]